MNGQEKDDVIKGCGNSYTSEYRAHDLRSGRWMSIDAEVKKLAGQNLHINRSPS